MKLKQLSSNVALLSLLTLTSCADKEHNDFHPEQQPVTYTEVSFDIGGELNVTETPLTRAAEKNLYGIAVSMLVKKDAGNTFTPEPYAYGIFDDEGVKTLKLNLIDGYKYRVSGTAVINGQDSLRRESGGYGKPFTTDLEGNTFGEITNKFVVAKQADNTVKFLYHLDDATFGSKYQENLSRSFSQRYHGAIDELDITGNSVNTLELYRRFFAVKISSNGLDDDQKLTFQIEDSPLIEITKQKLTSELVYVSLRSMTDKIEPGIILTENIGVKALLHEEAAAPKTIVDYNMVFKRNYLHEIELFDIDNLGQDSGITIHIETEQLQNDAKKDIPWQSN